MTTQVIVEVPSFVSYDVVVTVNEKTIDDRGVLSYKQTDVIVEPGETQDFYIWGDNRFISSIKEVNRK